MLMKRTVVSIAAIVVAALGAGSAANEEEERQENPDLSGIWAAVKDAPAKLPLAPCACDRPAPAVSAMPTSPTSPPGRATGWPSLPRECTLAGGVTIEERWTPPAGGAMIGTSRTMRGTGMTAYEFLCIVERDNPP